MDKSKEVLKGSARIFYIIDLILDNQNMRFSEIQRTSGIPKSSLHSLINELVDLKVLYHDPFSKTYSVGFNFIQLGYKCVSSIDLFKVIDAACLKLASTVKETVHAAILVDTNITYISKHEYGGNISIVNNIGMTLPAHATAIGKSLLSGYSNEELKKMYKDEKLDQFTPNTITSVDRLLEEVDKVRERGYSTEVGEISLLASCVGIPILKDNKIITSISITFPVAKLNPEYQNYIIDSLKLAKTELETLLNMGNIN